MRKLKSVHACLRRAARGAGKRPEQGLKNKIRQEFVSAMAARHGEAVAVSMNAGKNLLPCGEAQRGEATGELPHERGLRAKQSKTGEAAALCTGSGGGGRTRRTKDQNGKLKEGIGSTE